MTFVSATYQFWCLSSHLFSCNKDFLCPFFSTWEHVFPTYYIQQHHHIKHSMPALSLEVIPFTLEGRKIHLYTCYNHTLVRNM